MSDDLTKGLLSKKGSNFEKLSEDCLVRIQRIKQKNDVMQKQIGTDIQDSIREEIHKQSQFIEKQINQLRNLMNQMDAKFRDPEAKNRLKQIKNDAQKQIERNKVILKDLINRSFGGRSNEAVQDQEFDNGKYLLNGDGKFVDINGKFQHSESQNQSLLTDQHVEIDYDLERRIMKEKTDMINQVQTTTVRINEIMNDMGIMVEEQGQNLDVISEQLLKTNRNLVLTNNNMDEAQTLQKKAKKKYIFLVVLILLILLIAGGIVFFVVK